MTHAQQAPPGRQGYRALAQLASRLLAERENPRSWIEQNLFPRTKDRRVKPFRLNWVQQDYMAHRGARDVIVKARQLGITSVVSALAFADTLLRPNTTSAMIAHTTESAERIFAVSQLFWERLPEETKRWVGKPRLSNRRELSWPRRNSRLFVGTAGAMHFGRGVTINNLHCSEYAYWPDPQEALLSALEAVPEDGRVVIGSTANGMGDSLHDLWTQALEGRGRFRPSFYVWWEDSSYALPGPPLADLTAEERELIARWQLSHDQIRWRRAKQADLGEQFRQEYPEDPVTCFLASGRCIFNTDVLVAIQRRIGAEPPPRRLAAVPLANGTALPVPPATLLVWHEPTAGQHYAIGADVCEGLPEGDASCAVVLDRMTGEQVAELHGRVSPDRFGHLLNALGRYYRTAEIAVEHNNHGHSTLNTLRNTCLYPNLYYHAAYDSGFGRPRAVQLGWPTNSATKPILVDDLAEAINSESLRLHSALLVGECFSFILTDTGNAEAQPGKRDDRVMAAGIAWQVRKRPQPRMSSERPAGM